MKNPSGRRQRLLISVGALSVCIVLFFGLAVPGYAAERTICAVGNAGWVKNGPTSPTTFTTAQTYTITYFMTYHWNYGEGAPGGTVGLSSAGGETYGPWQVITTPGQNGVPDANWIATPNVVIPPGTYTVIDSDPSTWAQNEDSGGQGFAEIRALGPPNVELDLLYPVGQSPKVFTRGWVFTASCIDKSSSEWLSDKVEWSGTGSFQPSTGCWSCPTFNGTGSNIITLSITMGSETVKKDFQIEAVSPENYARVGTLAHCPADSHNCPACPHVVTGPVISGSPTVLINGVPAAREGDPGVHSPCCGPQTFVIAEGDPEVLIDGKPAARFGDKTIHCGGVGKLIRPAPVSVDLLLQ